MNALTAFIPFLIVLAIFYLLIIRPEQIRRKKLQELINNLKVGDKIVTVSGIHGTILSVRDDRLTIRSDQSRLEVSRSAVAGLDSRSDSTNN
ncbi:MAG: preprotein translocase subunit YajC [Acidobacteriota bacterium]|nr:preprotein translocase subunit YajC [Blastocatellia bacterium]MDW8238978.1 preprotein translocase subunit YajC [Acidobacteriota bacterium]